MQTKFHMNMYPEGIPLKAEAILISTSLVTPYIVTKFNSCVINIFIFTFLLAVPGHALLWLSLVKWKRKKRESARL
jgi:hypothetical protein